MILILINVRHAIHCKKVYIAQMPHDILGDDTVLQSIVEVSRRVFNLFHASAICVWSDFTAKKMTFTFLMFVFVFKT